MQRNENKLKTKHPTLSLDFLQKQVKRSKTQAQVNTDVVLILEVLAKGGITIQRLAYNRKVFPALIQ